MSATTTTTVSGTAPLNDPQRAAIEHGDGPLMVLAGAGTGKTRVLVHRIARLVETGVEPWAILAVTFTNKAAGEMRHRLRELLGDAADAMWIGTFHATCARLLRRFGNLVGLARGFSIYDDDDQAKVVERLIREAGIDEQISARAILARIDRAKNRGADPTAPTGTLDDAIERLYPLYRARLARENAVDFGDLLLLALDLLEREPAAGILCAKFRHVLVDEFQDTNQVQYRLVRGFSRETRNLTVVGDDDQSIYAWRGAEPRNLLDFGRDFPDAVQVKLEQNYRSTQSILDAANGVICRNRDRHDKALWTDRGAGDLLEICQVDDERAEAVLVAQAARRFLDGAGSRSPADIAVLYRTNAQSRVLEEYLRAARVPVGVVGQASFFDRREIRDVVAYLRILSNPAADLALERAINVPARGIGSATMDRLRAAARAGGSSLYDQARLAGRGEIPGIGAGPRKKIRAFVELIEELRGAVAGGLSVSGTVVRVIERSGMRERLESERSAESRGRLDNLAELVTMASDFDDETRPGSAPAGSGFADPEDRLADPWERAPAGSPDLGAGPVDRSLSEDFLQRVSLSSSGDSPTGDRVSLMTIHVAKGLEWPLVFVAGMEDGLFPSLRERDGASEGDALEEERRLAYVAITRAREQLVLSHARTRRVWGEVRIQERSRFLDDLPPGCVARRGAAASLAADRGVQGVADLAVGARVAHASLGDGNVVQVTGDGVDRRVLVEFDAFGRMTVLAGHLARGRSGA